MKLSKKFLAVLSAGAIMTSMAVPAFAAGTCTSDHYIMLSIGHCNANGVNIRTGAGTGYRSVGTANKGDVFNNYQTIAEAQGKENQDLQWEHVHGKHIGWMYGQYYTADSVADEVEPDIGVIDFEQA